MLATLSPTTLRIGSIAVSATAIGLSYAGYVFHTPAVTQLAIVLAACGLLVWVVAYRRN
jgi:hypothetical protein